MEVSSNLIEFNERLAVCEVTVNTEAETVTVHAMALSSESGRYIDLAQSRALAYAHKVLEEGLKAVGEMEPPTLSEVPETRPTIPHPTQQQSQSYPPPSSSPLATESLSNSKETQTEMNSDAERGKEEEEDTALSDLW